MAKRLVNDNPSPHDSAREKEHLGLRLREAREYLGLSQEFVANYLSVPRASISAMETGKRRVNSLELKQLAKLYKRPLSFFLGEEDQTLLQPDETSLALFRTARDLTMEDRKHVLQFAQFLRHAGRVPTKGEAASDRTQE
jgi:transcriptional regulator with XRE-family HTH domain